MEEFDSHTEHAQEQAHEAAHHAGGWITGVALTAALLAALAAVSSLISSHHEHEAMIEQIRASDKWSEYQAKRIKSLIREERIENLESSLGRADSAGADKHAPAQIAALKKKLDASKPDQATVMNEATELESSSRFHDSLHVFFGSSVTLLQVAIAVAAIAALTRKRAYWFVGMALGAIALGFFTAGTLKWAGVRTSTAASSAQTSS